MSGSSSTSDCGGRSLRAGGAWDSVSGAPFPSWASPHGWWGDVSSGSGSGGGLTGVGGGGSGGGMDGAGGGAVAVGGAGGSKGSPSPGTSLSGVRLPFAAPSGCSGALPALPDAVRMAFLLGAAPSAASAAPPSTPLERFGRAAGAQRRRHLLGLVLALAGPRGRAPSAALLGALSELDGDRPYVEPSAKRGAAALARRKGQQAGGGGAAGKAWQHQVPAADVLQHLGVRQCRSGLSDAEVRARLRQQRRHAAAVEQAVEAVASGGGGASGSATGSGGGGGGGGGGGSSVGGGSGSASSTPVSRKGRKKPRSSASLSSGGGGDWDGGDEAGGVSLADAAPSARRLLADASFVRSGVGRSLLRARVHRLTLVLRAGKQYHVPFEAVVEGDVVYVSAGREVPTDLRVLAASADCEMRRTGRSDGTSGGRTARPRPVSGAQSDEPKATSAHNMLQAGSVVTAGEAFGVALVSGSAGARRPGGEPPATPPPHLADKAAKYMWRAADTLLVEHAVAVRRLECLTSWTPAGVLLVSLPSLHVVRPGALRRAMRALDAGLVALVMDSDAEPPTADEMRLAGLDGLVEVLPRGRHPKRHFDEMMGGRKAALVSLSAGQVSRLVRDLTEVTGSGDQRPVYAVMRGRPADTATLHAVHAGAVPLHSSSHVAQDAASILLCSASLEDIYGFEWLVAAVREQARIANKHDKKKKCAIM